MITRRRSKCRYSQGLHFCGSMHARNPRRIDRIDTEQWTATKGRTTTEKPLAIACGSTGRTEPPPVVVQSTGQTMLIIGRIMLQGSRVTRGTIPTEIIIMLTCTVGALNTTVHPKGANVCQVHDIMKNHMSAPRGTVTGAIGNCLDVTCGPLLRCAKAPWGPRQNPTPDYCPTRRLLARRLLARRLLAKKNRRRGAAMCRYTK